MSLTREMEALVEAVALGLLNDDRTRNGWPAVDSLSHLRHEDAEAYCGSARAIIPLIYTAGLRAGREEAAKVAETIVGDRAGVPERIRIAASIRNLSEQESGRGGA